MLPHPHLLHDPGKGCGCQSFCWGLGDQRGKFGEGSPCTRARLGTETPSAGFPDDPSLALSVGGNPTVSSPACPWRKTWAESLVLASGSDSCSLLGLSQEGEKNGKREVKIAAG